MDPRPLQSPLRRGALFRRCITPRRAAARALWARENLCALLALIAILGLSISGSAPLAAQCTIDRLTPELFGASDGFGTSVAISGDAAAIGAPGFTSNSLDAGSVVLLRQGSLMDSWPLQQVLTPVTTAPGDRFGASVSLFGDFLLAGAPGTDNASSNQGNARVYQYLPTIGLWSLVATLVASDSDSGDEFGSAVAISGDIAICGAPLDDDNGADSGSAYIYRRDPFTGLWAEEQKLLPIDTVTGDRFGSSVAIEGDLALVGATGPGLGAGALFVYRQNSGTGLWEFEQRITPNDVAIFDQFATSISLSAGRILAGSWRDDDSGADSGSAYSFTFDPLLATWVEESKFVAPEGAAGDRFGFSVSLSGERAVVGAIGDDPEGAGSGAAFLFELVDGEWEFREELFDEPEGEPDDGYGNAVAIDGLRIAVGSAGHDGAAGPESGAVRFFETGDSDCNGNGVSDRCDLLFGTSPDLNSNGVPDECDFVEPVVSFSCVSSGSEASVTWINGQTYDAILVSIDGSAPLILAGNTTSYSAVGLNPGFHTVSVQGRFDFIESAATECSIVVDPPALSALSCAAGDPCELEALLTWGEIMVPLTSIDVTIGGAPAGSFAPTEVGASIFATESGPTEFCVTARFETTDPTNGDPVTLTSTPVCCTIEVSAVPTVEVQNLQCIVDSSDCSATLTWDLGSTYSSLEVLLDGVTTVVLPGDATQFVVTIPEGPTFDACVRAVTVCGVTTIDSCCSIVCGTEFVRSDSNADSIADLGDAITTLILLFNGGSVTCMAAADGNGDGFVDVSDVVYQLEWLFARCWHKSPASLEET